MKTEVEREKAAGGDAKGEQAAQRQEESVEKMVEELRGNGDLLGKAMESAEEILKDKSLSKPKRRYSDQFKSGALDRLTKEQERNRKARIAQKFERENSDIDKVSDKWREVLVSAFKEIVAEQKGDPNAMYEALSLVNTGVTKEELDVEE